MTLTNTMFLKQFLMTKLQQSYNIQHVKAHNIVLQENTAHSVNQFFTIFYPGN